MAGPRRVPRFARWLAAGAGVAAASYGACVGVAWLRYGHAAPPSDEDVDPLLEPFMPSYDVVDRHHVRVAAPADVTFAVVSEMDIAGPLPARAIFRAREWILGSTPDATPRPREFLPLVRSIGWGTLAERPGRQIVMGAVTQPWLADVVFRPLAPEAFEAFDEPGYVKIVWTVRADPLGDGGSIFRTETRVTTTDAVARRKFRAYWSFFSPGIVLIRLAMLGPLKKEAERRARVLR